MVGNWLLKLKKKNVLVECVGIVLRRYYKGIKVLIRESCGGG